MRFEIPPLDKVDIRLLKVFKTVTECQGFSAAEEVLNLSRSTISIHISGLETRFGVKLCTRGPAGFQLTPEGNVVYEATLRLFSELNHFRSAVAGAKGRLMGELAIWLMDNTVTDPHNPLGSGIRRFRERPNSVELSVNVVPSNDVERAVYDGRCAVGITANKSDMADLLYEPIYKETTLLYCGSLHPFFERSTGIISGSELGELDFVRRGYANQSEKWLDPDWTSTVTSMHTEATLQLILMGLHVGHLPDHYARRWVNEGLLRAINADRFRFECPVYLVSRRADHSSGLISTFVADVLQFRSI